MSNKTFEAIELALNNLNATAKKLILAPESEVVVRQNTINVENNFNIDNALALIGDVKYIGIVNAEKFNTQSITNLINILTSKNKATVVRLNSCPVSCKVFHPTPKVGTKHVEGSYEYRFGQSYGQKDSSRWTDVNHQLGWGVRILDHTQTDFVSPLTMIKGYPVTNMSRMFNCYHGTTLNLINWDTSNITNMSHMFSCNAVIRLDLSSFDTSKVTTMENMFLFNHATYLNISSFDTSNVTNMRGMFFENDARVLALDNFDTSNVTTMREMFRKNKATKLDLHSFNTAKVTDMSYMFDSSHGTSLDVSSFDTSNVKNMEYMFCQTQIADLDLSSFDTSNVTNINRMFALSHVITLNLSSFDIPNKSNEMQMFFQNKIQTLIVKTQADEYEYRKSSFFPSTASVIIA